VNDNEIISNGLSGLDGLFVYDKIDLYKNNFVIIKPYFSYIINNEYRKLSKDSKEKESIFSSQSKESEEQNEKPNLSKEDTQFFVDRQSGSEESSQINENNDRSTKRSIKIFSNIINSNKQSYNKSIIRKFRRFLVSIKEELKLENDSILKNFIFNKIIPPFQYCSVSNDKVNKTEFRSINISYIRWLFGFHEIKSLYKRFTDERLNSMLLYLLKRGEKTLSEQKQAQFEQKLKKYILNFSEM
jgi:hypothetical protein